MSSGLRRYRGMRQRRTQDKPKHLYAATSLEIIQSVLTFNQTQVAL